MAARWTAAVALLALAGNAGARMCDPDDEPGDCAALVDFGNALDYKSWADSTNWLSSESVCTWNGIKCSKNRVKEINLKNNGLSGKLPPTLGNLTAMVEFKIGSSRTPDYTGCSDKGTNLHNSGLPDSLYTIKALRVIDIEYACLGGRISPAVGQLTALTNISLHGNALTGPVPVEPGLNVCKPHARCVHTAAMVHAYPCRVQSCTELTELKIGRNGLTGRARVGFPHASRECPCF